MNKNKMKGFTLVELLAVIVVLAIILVIAVPQIMNTIKDTTKASFESSAKMVAAQVENQYTVAQTLSKEFGSTGSCMEEWAGLNSTDYESCTYKIENGTAKITLIGKGKFKDLKVEDGTRSSAVAVEVNEELGDGESSNIVTAASYITNLLSEEETLHNGLVQTYATINGEQVDAGIRYAGSQTGDNAVKNRVYFNCKDVDSNNINYGDEDYDYANNCEVWRIIGVFHVENSKGKKEKRVKIVRDAIKDNDGQYLELSFDSSSDSINSGYGINQWGSSTYTGGSTYEGADLMRMLNGYYIGTPGESCSYCNDFKQETCSYNCEDIVTPISATSLKMVDDALWYTGASLNNEVISLTTMYAAERSTNIGRICEATSFFNDKYLCTDTVERTATWFGKIGLIYPSDYGYASTDESCESDLIGSDSTCDKNNWLAPSNSDYWTISPNAYNERSTGMLMISSIIRVYNSDVYNSNRIRPALYLSSNVQIIGGDGTKTNEYILKISK